MRQIEVLQHPIAVVLVVLVLVGFSGHESAQKVYWVVGLILAALVFLWAMSEWEFFGDNFGIGPWFEDNFSMIVVGVLIIAAIAAIIAYKGGGGSPPAAAGGGTTT